MMALNVNQEILLELMEMSPQLVEELYSRNVLTKRHKDFICGPLAELKKSETFLDILRRRSFRDYRETIKCLRASNQRHIAEILEEGVVMRIRCTLKGTECCTIYRPEMEAVVLRLSEELKKRSLDDKNTILRLIGIGLIGVKFDNAIVLYFKCNTSSDLKILKTALDNREINTIAESDFRMLLFTDDDTFTAMLEWSQEDYNRCDNYMGWRHIRDKPINDLLMDVLEIILTKVYALFFFRGQPRPREEKLFAMLSSISQKWHETISRPCRFKGALNRRLYPCFLCVTKRQTIIRSNRQYLLEKMESNSNLIRRSERVGCLTSEQANYIENLQQNTAKNHELLNVARTMSFKEHFAFVESLHFCGQLKVANLLEKGGVLLKTVATSAGVSTDAEFIVRLNEKISETSMEYSELAKYIELLDVEIPKELEILEVQPLGRRRGKEHIVIWLWSKSHKSLRQLRKLAESDGLIKLVDILMTFLWLRGIENLRYLLHSFRYDTLPLQILKTLRLEPRQFHRAVVARQLSVQFSGKFEVPRNSRALTSLDEKIYVLTDDEISVHQYMAPYACQFKTVFTPSQSLAVYPSYHEVLGWFIAACHQTKCIYVARRSDQRVWKLTTSEHNLEVWIHYMATLCSLSVSSNGYVLILNLETQVGPPHYNACYLEMYTKDAVRLYNINLDVPSLIIGLNCSVLEMSPGNFAIKCHDILLVKSVNFDTLTSTDQNRIQYPNNDRKKHGRVASVALYSVNRLIAVLDHRLVILDSRLNVEIICDPNTVNTETVHYRKDKRHLMVCLPENGSVHIFTLQYEGEDLSEA